MVTFDRWIERYSARIRVGEFLRRAADWGAAYLFAFGAAVLIVKLAIPQAWPHVLWLAAGVVPATGIAWWLGRRGTFTRWQSVARLDAALGTGGLLMTLSEQPDVEWASRLPQLEQMWREAVPKLRPRRFASYLGMPLLFALGACFVPLREEASASPMLNSVGQQAAHELEAILEEIKKDRLIEKEEEKQLQEEVEKLAEETRDTPLTHEKWETVDALRERMKVRLETAAISTAKALDAAALLAAASGPDAPELSLERTEQLEKELAESLQKMMQKGGLQGASPELQEQLQRLMKSGKLKNLSGKPGERQELLDELKDLLEKEEKKLSELRKKCSGCKSGKCEGQSECEGSAEGNGNCNKPGRGGVTRGRGDADLTWGDESDKQGTKFKEVVLPKGFLDQPKEEIVGIQKSAPNEETAAEAARGAQRDLDPSAGQATWNRKLNPRHRSAVRKYFDQRPETK